VICGQIIVIFAKKIYVINALLLKFVKFLQNVLFVIKVYAPNVKLNVNHVMKVFVKIAIFNVNNAKKKYAFIAQKNVVYAKKNFVQNVL
jgi:hypothetical protein